MNNSTTATMAYVRKLSSEDVETGSIFITKDKWRMFLPPMEDFTMVVDAETFRTCIVAEECACVPPPHQPYHLEAGHFRHMLDFTPGQTVVMRRQPDGRCRVENDRWDVTAKSPRFALGTGRRGL